MPRRPERPLRGRAERSAGPGRGASPAPAGHLRLGRLLHERHPELSFSRAKAAIVAGQVRVEGVVETDPGAWVGAGAELDWDENRPRHRSERAVIVHLDADVVVVDKPAGLLTVPTTDGDEHDTLVTRVVRELRRRGERPHVDVLHRLDRDTSGLLAFARSRSALHALQTQLLDRTMGRLYTAIVVGGLGRDAGTFSQELIGDGLHSRRRVVRPGEAGKVAVTHWRVVERFPLATRVEVSLETGRTHQIRIHFSTAGHPLLGETVYRRAGTPDFPLAVPRLALHAGELHFRHPSDGRPVSLTAALPADLAELLGRLRQSAR